MYKPINRTTVQIEENKCRVYPKQSPIFYKNANKELNKIDLTFNDSTSTVGDISLMNQGIMSVGKRKDKNPYKITGIRPDNCQTGEKQLEFSVVNIELDDVKQEFDDIELKLETTSIFQLVKLNKSFGKCKIEFDIHTKGLQLDNNKYKESKKISEYGFNITNIGNIKGEDSLSMYKSYSSKSKDFPYLDCYLGKITNNYITSGGYTNEEEFGNNDLSEYSIKNMYLNGGSMYLKDCIIFAAKPYNIENFKEILVNQICDIYNLESLSEGGTGEYFTKDNKKIGGYFSNDNTFFAFFNTNDIPSEVKALFQTKTFEDTSFLDLNIDDFYEKISNRLNKNLDILVDTNYYEPINDSFKFKVNNNYFCIHKPLAFNEEYNILNYKTTHTLTDNEDGTYKYTKYLLPESALNVNNAKYFDATVSTSEDGSADQIWSWSYQSTSTSQDTEANFNTARNLTYNSAVTPGIAPFPLGSTQVKLAAGERSYTQFTPAGKDTPAVTTYYYQFFQDHMHFDTSGIIDNVLTATINVFGYAPQGAFDGIYLKSYYNGTPQSVTSGLFTYKYDWNNFFSPGGQTSTPNGWGASDVTAYTAETSFIAGAGTSGGAMMNNQNATSLNSTAKTDLENNDDFALCLLEHDEYYSNNYTASAGIGTPNANSYAYHTPNSLTTAYRPYIEYTTGTAPPAATENSTFFGANF